MKRWGWVTSSGRLQRVRRKPRSRLRSPFRSACSGGVLGVLVGTGNNPTPTFDLSAPTNFGTLPGHARGLLAVEQPTALHWIRKSRDRTDAGRGGLFPDAQWVDRLPKLLQARIVQTFENSSRIRAVAKTQDRVSADYLLVVDVRQFGIQAYDGPTANVELSVKIVYQRGGRDCGGDRVVFCALRPAAPRARRQRSHWIKPSPTCSSRW